MSGEEQERFEDYLELERFIAELQASHTAYPPQELTPTQASVYRMAMLFHAATPGVGEPDADFAARLQERLEKDMQTLPLTTSTPPIPAQTSAPLPVSPKTKRRVPRRWLLAGSVSAAASMVVGAGVEHVMDMATQPHTPSPQAPVIYQGPEVTIKLDTPMDWFPVTTVAEMGNQAVKFRAEDQRGTLSLTGYVVRSNGANGDPAEKGQIVAMSAACTHKGCIVEWSGTDRRFHCPCHGGIFSEDGGIDTNSSSLYLNPLPRLDVREDNGQIYVRMPAS
jgi:Rieske Fe-S protein